MTTSPDLTPDIDIALLREQANAATSGPWRWNDYSVPDLVGFAGGSDYLYTSEVIEVSHDGGCGCRSACQLELDISPEDKTYIAAANPAVLLALLDRLEHAEAALAERG